MECQFKRFFLDKFNVNSEQVKAFYDTIVTTDDSEKVRKIQEVLQKLSSKFLQVLERQLLDFLPEGIL